MKLFRILVLIALPLLSMGQSTIFTENCGNPSATTVVSSYTGWQNYGVLTYTGTADVRTTLPSTTYTGASGQGNTFITNAVGTNVTFGSINTTNYTSLSLSLGILKTTTASNGSNLTIEVSTDGATYIPLSFLLATGTGTANTWYRITPTGTIPATANLRIRFRMNTNTTGLQFRIDDIKLTGCLIPSSPTPTYTSPACVSTVVTFPANSYLQSSVIGTSTLLASPQTITTSDTQYLRTVSTVTGCTSIWSSPTTFSVTIRSNPTITTNPTDTTAIDGATVRFISSSPNNHIWQYSSDSGISWNNIDTISRDTLTISPISFGMNGFRYRIQASNSPCNPVTSISARLNVLPNTLPVKWLYFNGIAINDVNHLKWITATEIDNWKFEVQRSLDGVEWDVAGYVLGHGTSSSQNTYIFYDKCEYSNITNIYYRLKQIDFNDNSDYSDIIVIKSISLNNGPTKHFDLLGRVVKQNSFFTFTK
jgi:hypothetical protein